MNNHSKNEESASSEFDPQCIEMLDTDCTFIFSSKRNSLEFSEPATRSLGMPERIRNPSLNDIAKVLSLHPDDESFFRESLRHALAARGPLFTASFRIRVKTGGYAWLAAQGKCLYTESGGLQTLYGTVFDIDNMDRHQRFLKDLLMVNPVTMLPNRKKLLDSLQKRLAAPNEKGYLILLDIVDFKAVNGFYSHTVGDRILRKTSRTISKLCENGFDLYHYAVDKFVVVAAHTAHHDVERLMTAIRDHFAASPVCLNDLVLNLRFTATAVEFTSGTKLDDLLADLDIALQVAKTLARGEVSFFTDEERRRFLEKAYLESELKASVKNDFAGFNLHYQPIVDKRQKRCVGAEALLRWKNAEGNFVSPTLIVPALENTRLMPEAEKWILDNACRQCALFIDQGMDGRFRMHVNLSSACLSRSSLADEVCGALEKHRLKRENLYLEVTESSLMKEMGNAVRSLESLREKGIRISLDDFGTGYSSLSYMRTLPLDEIKIDRSFVVNTESDESSRKFLFSIILLARSMDFHVCLEGVENDAQLSLLEKTDLDCIQGYYFGEPVDAGSFAQRYATAGRTDR